MPMPHRRFALALLLSAPLALAALAAGRQAKQPDDNRLLQKNLGDTAVRSSWIYNDVDAGFAAAKRSGKPLLIVFR